MENSNGYNEILTRKKVHNFQKRLSSKLCHVHRKKSYFMKASRNWASNLMYTVISPPIVKNFADDVTTSFP
jgi:hypothetical protein